MRYILWIEWEGFYVSLCEKTDLPLIVVREGAVLDANSAARVRGVADGMAVKQAKTLAYGCLTYPWKEDEYTTLRNDWLDVCCDYSGVIEPIDQHIAAVDLSAHPKPMDVSEELIRALADRFDFRLRYGAATTKWIARLAAHRDDLGLAATHPREFLARLDVNDLLPIPVEMRQRLSFLGYRTIGQVSTIPLSTLQRQFGQEGLLIQQAANGGHLETVEAAYPLDSIRECLLFESPIEDQQVVDVALSQLGRRVGDRLQEAGLHGFVVELSFELEESTPVVLSRVFTKPLHHPLSVQGAIRVLTNGLFGETDGGELGTRFRGVEGVRVCVRDLRRVKTRQKPIEGFLVKESLQETAETAVKQIQNTFGGEAVKLGSEIVPPRRVRVLKEWQIATGWR